MGKYLILSYDDIDYKPGDIIRIKSIPGSRGIVKKIDGCFVLDERGFPFFKSEIEFHEDQLANIRQQNIDLILDGKS